MKVLVTGATGQLGHDVCKELARRGVPLVGVGSTDCDITREDEVRALFDRVGPDAVVHCAGYTAVDRAEDERERAFAVNGGGARNIARACREAGAKLVYISTDYVFPGTGDGFYEVDDPTGPLGVYGASKLAGERAVREALEEHFIVRISWLFGKNGNNFVKTMLRLAQSRDEVGVVADQVGSPTYTADLAPLLCDMLDTDRYGVYHATNEGVCSWARFAQEIFRLAGRQTRVNPISTAEYPTRAERPLNSRLDKSCLDRAGFERLPSWQDALARYLEELGEEQGNG